MPFWTRIGSSAGAVALALEPEEKEEPIGPVHAFTSTHSGLASTFVVSFASSTRPPLWASLVTKRTRFGRRRRHIRSSERLRSDPLEALAAGFTDGDGVDAVLVCASSPSNDPVELAARLCRDRGRVVVVGAVGMTLPREPYYEKELELRLSRSYGPGRYDPTYEEHGHDYPIGYVRWTEQRNLGEFLRLVRDGRVDVDALTTHRFSIEQAPEAYGLVSGKTEGAQRRSACC